MIACEICGSIDVRRDISGYFVCQDCGARYTIEAIREMVSIEPMLEPAPTKPKTTEDRIKDYFDDENYSEAYELYSNLSSPEPNIVVFGELAKYITLHSQESDDADTVLLNIVNTYVDALDEQRTMLRREKIDCIFAATALMTTVVAKVYQADVDKLIIRHKSGEVSPEEHEEAMLALDKILAHKDRLAIEALERIAGYVDEGYIPNVEQKANIATLFNSMAGYNRTWYTSRQVYRLINAEESNTKRIIPENANVNTVLDIARNRLSMMDVDISYRAYKHALKLDEGNYEAECLSTLLFSLRNAQPLFYIGRISMSVTILSANYTVMHIDRDVLHKFNPHMMTVDEQVVLAELLSTVIDAVCSSNKEHAMTVAKEFAAQKSEEGSTAHSEHLERQIYKRRNDFEEECSKALLKLAKMLTELVIDKEYMLTDKAESDRWNDMFFRTPERKRDVNWYRSYSKFKKIRL